MTRKTMIQNLTASAAALFLTDKAFAGFSFSPDGNQFIQEPLTYDYNALEPIIDSATMEIHYSKHAAGYCSNLNKAVVENNINISNGLEFILSQISNYPLVIRNHGGGHYNHELFWKCMKPGGSVLSFNKLNEKILSTYGSFENFQKIFTETALARFGSGWAWLIADQNGQLSIVSSPNQDNPIMDLSPVRGYPLLGLDVWEHAYYLKYQNRRAEYIKQWWSIVDWEYVSQRYLNFRSRL